ncbi:unnamed protein product [Mytilus coruscus]|uniref:Uncharacterized protein n=1 Tax=Mytilus coruscus TaxID=42192 RepID=A0A6J8CAJ0_MYTCO|nr:unnamed protein product [Mytilus coruscus]
MSSDLFICNISYLLYIKNEIKGKLNVPLVDDSFLFLNLLLLICTLDDDDIKGSNYLCKLGDDDLMKSRVAIDFRVTLAVYISEYIVTKMSLVEGKLVRLMLVFLICFVFMDTTSAGCCRKFKEKYCKDCTKGTPCCGHDKCNIFCCGCRCRTEPSGKDCFVRQGACKCYKAKENVAHHWLLPTCLLM